SGPPSSRQLAAAPAGGCPRRAAGRVRPVPRPGLDGGRAHAGAGERDWRAGAAGVDRARPARLLARRDSPKPVAAGSRLGQHVHGSRRAGTEHRAAMKTRVVDEPGLAAETEAFLARLGPASPISGYPALLAARAEPSDVALSGEPDPAAHIADLYLPARHGPVGVRWYRARSAAGPGPVLLWLHGGGFIGGTGCGRGPCPLRR